MGGRRIELQGAFNFRDLGGHRGRYGTTVVEGRLFRSDGLHRLLPADVLRLEPLAIGRVFDLRSDAELAKDGIGDFARSRHVHVPLVAVTLSPFDPEIDWGRINLQERYVEMLETGGHAIRAVIEAAAELPCAPLVFHCTGGKDRTGVVAAVVLRTLGVGDDDIVADYACSQEYLREFLAGVRDELLRRGLSQEAIAYLTSSPPERMRRTLRELDRRWGSVERYLDWIGVDEATVDRLRENLLQ